MKPILGATLAAALTTAAGSATAAATASYETEFVGTADVEVGAPPVCLPGDCSIGFTDPWWGKLFVTVDAPGDGTFVGADVVSINFETRFSQTSWTFDTPNGTTGFDSVVIRHGKVSLMEFSYDDFNAVYDVDGRNVRVSGGCETDCGAWQILDFVGTATMAPVPEPTDAALLLAGLGGVARLGRRRSRR